MTEHLSRNNVTDSERAAGWAAQALNEGRYELGLTLSKIAVQAERIERDQAQALNEAIRPTGPEYLHAIRPAPAEPIVLRSVPTAGGTEHLQRRTDGGTEYIARVQPLPTYAQLADLNLPSGPTGNGDADLAQAANGVPDSRRCRAQVDRDGVRGACHGVAYYSPEHHAWVHVHPGLEDDHSPDVAG